MTQRALVTAALIVLFAPGLIAQEVEQDLATEVDAAQTAPALERETFSYVAGGRRDPFRPLEAGDEIGPRFEDLELSGIIYSPEAGSVVVLVDRSTQRRYRVWEGDIVGGAQLLDVTPNEAIFVVTVFGVSRQETLRLKNMDKEQGG
jgi:type II secretory pathway component PulC